MSDTVIADIEEQQQALGVVMGNHRTVYDFLSMVKLSFAFSCSTQTTLTDEQRRQNEQWIDAFEKALLHLNTTNEVLRHYYTLLQTIKEATHV